MDVKGFQIDKNNMIAPLIDKDEVKYYLLTFDNEIIDNNVDATGFKMTEIDLENFIYNGRKCRIVIE